MKLVISSNFWLFVLISALMLFVLLVMILLFSVQTSIPCALALFCAGFHLIRRCSAYVSAGEVLKFTAAAAHKIDVVGKS